MILKRGENTKYLPYVFTEHGAIMAKRKAEEFSVLKSQFVTLDTGRGQHREYLNFRAFGIPKVRGGCGVIGTL